MNFKDLTEQEKLQFADMMFQPLSSAQELKDWIMFFLGLDMPIGHVDPDSNSSPVDAMWQIYETLKLNKGAELPGFIMLSAREGYKCQAKGSKLLTKNGIKNIEEASIGEEIWTGFSWQKITNHIDDGFKDGIKVKVRGGLEYIGSPIHRYWVLRDGKEQWIESKNLNPQTDRICVNTNTGLADYKVKNKEEYEIGYFLGLLIGDGGVSSIESGTHKHFTLTTIDPYIKDFFYYFIEKYFKSKISIASDKITYAVWDKNAIEKIKEWGITASRSWEKTIPSSCYKNLDRMLGLIAGIFDTDGSFSSEKGNMIISMTCGPMLKELQKILVSFGIFAKVRDNKKLYKEQKHIISTLTVNKWDIYKLHDLGIEFKAKKSGQYIPPSIPDAHDVINIENCIDFIKLCNSYDYIQIRNRQTIKEKLNLARTKDSTPYRGITRFKLSRLVEWMKENNQHDLISSEAYYKTLEMEKILKNKWSSFELEKVNNVHFFDLTVENDHSYWSNGSISHNTLSASILEVLLMLHFKLTIAHMAAIQSQSAKSIQYINYFFAKVEPLLTAKGWQNKSQNKSKIEYRTPDGEDVYIRVVIASLSGANSEHTNIMVIDEIDVIKDPLAYEEAKLIPGYSKGIYPVTIKLSTRKFAFGLMAKELDMAPVSGDKILRWNIVDVTERCPPSRHKPELPKEDRYVNKNLPTQQISVLEYESMPEAEKTKWELVKDAFAGCQSCNLLPVCKTRLADRKENDFGGLYKPIDVVINNFKKTNPDMAEAQLMCWRPSTKGLVYPRFESEVNKGNIITLNKAYEILIGEPPKKNKVTEIDLVHIMKNLNIRFFAGVDWGYTHDFVIVIFALIPNGEIWIVDCYSSPGLEFPDILDVAKGYRDKYSPEKWFCDQAMPSHIKSFTKNGMKSPHFTKDVMGGIEALRSKIVDGSGRRYLKVLLTEANKKIINAFVKHHFKLGPDGNPTLVPDDTPGVADPADAMRYVAQNLFPIKGPHRPMATVTEEGQLKRAAMTAAEEQMKQEIASRIEGGSSSTGGSSGKKGGFFWDI